MERGQRLVSVLASASAAAAAKVEAGVALAALVSLAVCV